MATTGSVLLALAGFALVLFFFYLFYGMVHRAFQRIGFTPGQASAILMGTLFLSFLPPIRLLPVGDWVVAISIGGALIPIAISIALLRKYPTIGLEAVTGVTIVAVVTYLVTSVTPEGIVSPFPLWLLPPITAALVSLAAFWREETAAAPLAYVSGVIGTLIGADVLRLGEFLSQTPAESGAIAAIGGAQVFDMVFLTGVLAVSLDILVFRQLRRSGILDESGPLVFRSNTRAEVIRDYDPAKHSAWSEQAQQRQLRASQVALRQKGR